MSTSQSIIERLTQEGQRQFRRELALESKDSVQRLATSYQRVLKDVNVQLRELRVIAGEKGMTTEQLAQEAAFIRLRDKLKNELDGFSKVIRREAEQMQAAGIEAGIASGGNTLQTTLGSSWGRPAPTQVQALFNYVDSAPFQENLAQYGDAHVQGIVDRITVGFSQGYGPERIARQISKYTSDFPLADAIRMTRTVGIWSQRQGTMAVYRENADLVSGWIWSCALDEHVCMSCWAMQGSRHSLDEILNDHHLGRCAPVPITKSWADLGFGDGSEVTANVPTGEDYFSKLSVAEQKKAMGAARWAAWKDGLFKFDALSTTYQDAVYGEMRKAATLDFLIGTEAAAAYKRNAGGPLSPSPLFPSPGVPGRGKGGQGNSAMFATVTVED
jgi:hypothetical protein